MADNYTLDGDNYTQEEVLEAAESKGLTIDDYISEYYPDENMGKQNDSAIADPITESSMDSGSESGSSGSVQDDLGISTPVESTSFDQMFTEDGQVKKQRYAHIDENTFSLFIKSERFILKLICIISLPHHKILFG